MFLPTALTKIGVLFLLLVDVRTQEPITANTRVAHLQLGADGNDVISATALSSAGALAFAGTTSGSLCGDNFAGAKDAFVGRMDPDGKVRLTCFSRNCPATETAFPHPADDSLRGSTYLALI